MRRIYKFTLQPGLNVLRGITKVLGVGWQSDDLRLWGEFDDQDYSTRLIKVLLTGEQAPDDADFLATAVGSEFVGHVYQVKS